MHERECGLFHSAIFVALVIGAGTEAIEFFHGDQVDHTGYCVRAVQSRTTVQYHFHPRNRDVGNEAGNGSVHRAHAIHQREGAVLAKAAQVEGGACRTLTAVGAGVDVGDGIGVLRVGQVTNVLPHVGGAGLVKVFLSDGVDGGILSKLAVANIGTGDDDFFDFRCGIRLGLRQQRQGHGGDDAGMNQIAEREQLTALWHEISPFFRYKCQWLIARNTSGTFGAFRTHGKRPEHSAAGREARANVTINFNLMQSVKRARLVQIILIYKNQNDGFEARYLCTNL